MFWEIFLSVLIAGAVMFVLWGLRGVMLTPVRVGRNSRLTMVLTVTGDEPQLESGVDALLWLRANGTLPGRIVLVDGGMNEETRAAAELLARGHGDVTFLRGGEAELWTKEAETFK